MRYRISKSQIKMLLDGKTLSMGNGRKLILPRGTEVFERLAEIMSNPAEADKRSFFTDGVTIFVEGKDGE
jgi:hypothetical protein